jgi:hypothetical protein
MVAAAVAMTAATAVIVAAMVAAAMVVSVGRRDSEARNHKGKPDSRCDPCYTGP